MGSTLGSTLNHFPQPGNLSGANERIGSQTIDLIYKIDNKLKVR